VPRKDCAVEFHADETSKPSKPYGADHPRRVAHPAQCRFRRQGDAAGRSLAGLRKQDCPVGADAVLIDDYIESSALEFSHVHVSASLVRYLPAPPAAVRPH
jgi:hypothetical protein